MNRTSRIGSEPGAGLAGVRRTKKSGHGKNIIKRNKKNGVHCLSQTAATPVPLGNIKHFIVLLYRTLNYFKSKVLFK